MDETNWANLPAMFFGQAAKLGEKPLLWSKHDGLYSSLSWQEIAERVTLLARGLKDLDIKPGDRVLLVSENSPLWFTADIAIMSIGAITVPAYTTNTSTDHLHLLTDSGAKAAIVSNHRLGKTLLQAALDAPELKFVVTAASMDLPEGANFDIHNIKAATERGREDTEDISQTCQQWQSGDTACIIYTSGTGGTPKGVMLTHRNLFHNCLGATDALTEIGIEDNVFLSFLPLSHSYEHMAGQFFPVMIGAEIYYAESIEGLATNMSEVHPTIMTAVPRLYEILYEKIMAGVKKQKGLKKILFMRTLALGKLKYENRGKLGPLDKIQDWILDRLVRDKIRARFGGKLKALVSGGAPLNPDIGLFFTSLGLLILQGYGQTETSPLISVNRPNNPTVDTVGPPVKNTEVRIADDGEILARGDLVMKGYWNNETATKEVIRDGWVYTGDIGEFTPEGNLKITDRKKDIMVNTGGDNIAPQRLEGILALEPEIAQVMAYGDRCPHMVALIVPAAAWLREWARGNGKENNLTLLASDPGLHKALAQIVTAVNKNLSKIEKIRHFIIATEEFSIENEQLTPTMKIRRHKIIAVYQEQLDALYR